MGGMSIWHWVIVGLDRHAAVRPRQDLEMMGDVAKGIKAFKKGMSEDDTVTTTTTTVPTSSGTETVRTIEHRTTEPATSAPVTADRKAG
jgi:sec-independent protein translocase protein TatA